MSWDCADTILVRLIVPMEARSSFQSHGGNGSSTRGQCLGSGLSVEEAVGSVSSRSNNYVFTESVPQENFVCFSWPGDI